MSFKKISKSNKEYATVIDDDGVNYREIADIMSEVGFIMNHSSARNYVLRVMKKFVAAFDKTWDLSLSNEKIETVAASPQFQSIISDMLHNLMLLEKTNKL